MANTNEDYRNTTNIEDVPFRSLHQAYGEALDRERKREKEQEQEHGMGMMMPMDPAAHEQMMRDCQTIRRFKREAGDFPGTGNVYPESGTVEK